MIVNIKLYSQETYLPTKRHRIPKERHVMNNVDIEIVEPSEEEFPVAFVVHDYVSIYEGAKSYFDFESNHNNGYKMVADEIRVYKGELYKAIRVTHGSAVSTVYESVDYITDRLSDTKPFWEEGVDFSEKSIVLGSDLEKRLEDIKRESKNYIYYDDKVWRKCGEPVYKIQTFGLGNNHGGTGFFIEYERTPYTRENGRFNALQREDAINYGKRIAFERGDTDFVDGIGSHDIIEVLMPEMVKVRPYVDKQKIAVIWEMCGFIEVEGNTIEEAMRNFENNPDEYELPRDGEYVDGSFVLSTDDVDTMEIMVSNLEKGGRKNDKSDKYFVGCG